MISYDCPKFDIPSPDMGVHYDLMYGLAELTSKWPQYREARRKFKGEIDEFSNNLSIERILAKTSELYRFNLAAIPVKVMRNRLKLGGIRLDAGPQKEFDLIWTANDMEVWFPKIVTTMLKYGDAYVRAWTMPEEDTGEEDDDLVKAGVVVNLQHPMTTCVIYDEDTQRRALYAVKYYTYGKKWRADLEYRDRIYHFITRGDNNRGLKVTDWEAFSPPYQVIDANNQVQTEYADPEEVNPFGEISIKHARTDLPYGVPLHIDAYGPQNAISKLLVTEMATVDMQGWPARVALVDPATALDSNHDAPNWGDEADAPGDDGRATVDSSARAEPGSVEIMDGIKAIDQWDAADPKVFTDPVELYMSLMSTLTETPLYSFKPGGEQPSGKARQIADAPLEANKERLQALLNGFLRDLVRFIMKAAGSPVSSVEVAWKPTVLATDLDDWQVIAAKRTEGVPFDVRMAEAGYDSDTIAKWLDEKEDFSLQEKINLAAQIGEMIKNLNVAVDGGIIDEKTANKILADVMTKLGFTVGAAPEPKPVPAPLMGGINNDGSTAGAPGVPVPPGPGGAGKPGPGVPAPRPGGPPGKAGMVPGA